MMRLQYVWVEKYKCLNNAEFNFTGKFRFSKKENVLSFDDKNADAYIEKLVDENTDISVVVGKNGTGKTTLLRLLKSFACGNGGEFSGSIIIVFDNTDIEYSKQNNQKNFTIYTNGNVTFSSDLTNKTVAVKAVGELSEDQKSLYVYYSPFIQNVNDNRMPIDQQGAKDLSAGFLLRKKEWGVQDKSIKFPFQEYLTDEYRKQIAFFTHARELIEGFEIKYPEYAEVFLINNEALIPADMGDNGGDLYKSQIIGEITNIKKIKYDVTDRESFIEAIAHGMLLSFLIFLVYPLEQPCKVNLGKLGSTYSVQSIKEFFSSIASDNNSAFQKEASASVAFLQYLENDARWGTGNFLSRPWKISLEKEPETGCIMGDLKEFFNHYSETVCGNPYLSFSWPLSSGEMTVLSMMSRFYELREEVKAHNIQCLRILLDEAETALHPEWQRRFLNIFQNAMREMFPGKYIQIIAATHSPIILSDVPRQNVVLLNPPDDRTARFSETFGANIYSLYHDDFFLDKYCGEFAREKIEEVIDSVYKKSGKKRANKPAKDKTNKSIAYKEAKKRVNLIGDKFIKNELQRMIDKIDRKEHREDVSN